MSSEIEGLRLTELLASLSLATDLGTGQPLGHGLRTSLLSVELARRMGLTDERVRTVQQVSLLRFLGCTADSAETAEIGAGDDLSFNASMAPFLYGGMAGLMRGLIRSVAPRESAPRKARLLVRAISEGDEGLTAHCEVAAMLARRLGLEARVVAALEAAYERWDGRGPGGLEGESIPVEIRIATVAKDIDVVSLAGGDVAPMLQDRSGKGYDPAVVDVFSQEPMPQTEADWDRVLEAEPKPVAYLGDLDAALRVIGEFADLKSPWTRGHSTLVAELARTAAKEAGLSAGEADEIRRAALVHDVGRVGIENGIWDKPGPLSTDEREKVETHSYLTQRILARCPQLASLALLASSHHERLDGSGYHRQHVADQLPVEARLLAAADVMAALMSQRPHRPAMDLESASALLRSQVDSGLLDRQAAECVIAAAGGETEHGNWANPDGLTDREVEVLRLISRGLTNRQVAGELFISTKTVGRHIENIYAKIGVSTRAGAAVYAMEHRLLNQRTK